MLDQRAYVIEFSQSQPGNEPAHRHPAKFRHGMGRYRLGRALEDKSALPGQWLGLNADALWIEILRACIHGAQIALAAIERGHHGVQAGFKTERLHGAMRFDRMAEQEARAEFRAETALVAGRTADLADLHR